MHLLLLLGTAWPCTQCRHTRPSPSTNYAVIETDMVIDGCPGAATVIVPGEPTRSPGPVTENETSFVPDAGVTVMPAVGFAVQVVGVASPDTFTVCATA